MVHPKFLSLPYPTNDPGQQKLHTYLCELSSIQVVAFDFSMVLINTTALNDYWSEQEVSGFRKSSYVSLSSVASFRGSWE